MRKFRYLWPLGVWLGVAVIIAAIFAASALDERKAIIEKGLREAQDRADLVAEHASRIFEGAELAMGAAVRDVGHINWDSEPDLKPAWNDIRGWVDLVPYVARMVILDDKGVLRLHSDFFPIPFQDLSNRSYFNYHSHQMDTQIWIGEPITGTISRQHIFTLSKRINRAGKFNGVVVTNISYEAFNEFYKVLGIDTSDFVNIQRSDGIMLSRYPFAEGAIGQQIDNSKIFPLLASGGQKGAQLTKSPIDGEERLTAFRRVSHFDALAMAGVSIDALLENWRSEFYKNAAILGLTLVVISGLFALLLAHHQRALLANENRLAAEQRYRQIFKEMLNGFAEFEILRDGGGKALDCRIIDANPALERIFRLPHEAILNQTLRGLFPTIDNFWIETINSVAIGGAPCQFTHFMAPLAKHLEVAVFRRAENTCAMVVMDVSEQEKRRVALETAVDQLSEKNAELERFAYISSHDLKEPLRTITSFSQLLNRRYAGQFDAQADEYIGFITGAAKRMHELITDLLEYSRVSARTMPFAEIDLRDVCQTSLENLRQAISESGAEVLIDALPRIFGDPTQLGLLMQNLVSNAIKFTPSDRKPRVIVTARPGDIGWIISVSDNGVGIHETNQDIFEIFRRLHAGHEYPGTGVGLAICKRIVQRHGGKIWYEANPDQGTTFIFTLPRSQVLSSGQALNSAFPAGTSEA
jgi:signal transduction histidine kinase